VDVGNEAPEAGQDLRGALVEAFKQQKEAAAPVEKVELTPEQPEKTAAERARDEAGRFVKKDEHAAPVQTKAPDEIKQTPAKAEVTEEVKPAEKRIPAPPNGWSPDAKAHWHELPPKVMEAIAQREQDLGRAAGKMDEERALGREIDKVFAPYKALLAAENTNPVLATQALLNTAYILRQGSPEQKKQAVMAVCQQHGIDLGISAGTTGAAQVSPELAELRQEVSQLRSMLSQGEMQTRSAAQAQLQQEIDAFEADPAHVHYQEVKQDMVALLSAGRAQDLKTAYDMACWARPDVRTSILAQQRAEDEQKRRESERVRAEDAKRKAVSVTGAPGITTGVSSGNRTLRQELEANMAALRGSV
jgi:hypothetical protein